MKSCLQLRSVYAILQMIPPSTSSIHPIEAWMQPTSWKKNKGGENLAYFHERWGKKNSGEKRKIKFVLKRNFLNKLGFAYIT